MTSSASPHDRDEVIAVEIELTAKRPDQLRAGCRAWNRTHHVSQIRYYAAPEALRRLKRAIEETATEDRIQLQALPQ